MATEHTKLRTANLILASFTWRFINCQDPCSASFYAGQDAISCAVRGDAEGAVRLTLNALYYRYGRHHFTYKRALAVAKARGFTPVDHG